MSNDPLPREYSALASNDDALQQEARPRPLPAFLKMLRSEARGDAERIAAVLKGVRRYQEAERDPAIREARVFASVGRVSLLDYGGSGRPIVFVPSLINGSEILDLDADRSLMRWLAAQGLRPLLVDWGNPGGDEADLDLTGHVTQLLNPLLARLDQLPILVGYCLGGTLALAAATAQPVHALALIASPWDFEGFEESSTTSMSRLWAEVEPQSRQIGLMPMEALQLLFWQLDPQRTLDKFERLGRREDAESLASFVPVEDWANAGPPMPYAAARELMDELFDANTAGRGRWTIEGKPITPGDISVPTFEIVSTTDRIVPAASSANFGNRLALTLGHVGMIVSGQARTAVWEPLAAWLRAVS